jgi:hypothetical protein
MPNCIAQYVPQQFADDGLVIRAGIGESLKGGRSLLTADALIGSSGNRYAIAAFVARPPTRLSETRCTIVTMHGYRFQVRHIL